MTDSSGRNPFRPGVGTRPLHLAGRDAPLRRFAATLRAAPEQPANIRLTGLRGVGKTVLLSEFETRANEADWATVSLELQPRHNTEDAVVGALGGLAQRAREQLSRAERIRAAAGRAARTMPRLGVSWGDITISLDPTSGQGVGDLAHELFEVVEVAVDKARYGVLVLLDEAQTIRDERARQGEHPLSLLISAVVALQRRELPLGLVICGLPTLTGNLLHARSYTERMFRGEEIGSLDVAAAREAIVEPLAGTAIGADNAFVEVVIEEVEGYPYFIQLWGAEAWDAAHDANEARLTTSLLSEVTPDIYRRLDSDFYDPRVATLTPAEQDLLLSTAECPSYPPLIVSEINEASEKTPGNINVLLGRLVQAGVLYRIRKGQYDYTAPKFHDYLTRRLDRT
jgi:hypothetical protein